MNTMNTKLTQNGITIIRTKSFDDYIKFCGYNSYKEFEKMMLSEYGEDELKSILIHHMYLNRLVKWEYGKNDMGDTTKLVRLDINSFN